MLYTIGMKVKYVFTQQQLEELKDLAYHSPTPHVRIKALAVYSVGQGKTCQQVSGVVPAERRSIGRWVRSYLKQGANAFAIKKGRGRRPRVSREEVEHYLRQAPSQFGFSRTRWTLAMLATTVPDLRGMSLPGIYLTLKRLGYRSKRGQPAVHSPDPDYGEKRGP